MSENASALMGIILIAGAFGGGFLFLLFMLWASGRSPIVRIAGEFAAALLYLVMALAQAWLNRGTDDATLWKVVSVGLAITAISNAFRFSKIYRQKVGASALNGTAKP